MHVENTAEDQPVYATKLNRTFHAINPVLGLLRRSMTTSTQTTLYPCFLGQLIIEPQSDIDAMRVAVIAVT